MIAGLERAVESAFTDTDHSFFSTALPAQTVLFLDDTRVELRIEEYDAEYDGSGWFFDAIPTSLTPTTYRAIAWVDFPLDDCDDPEMSEAEADAVIASYIEDTLVDHLGGTVTVLSDRSTLYSPYGGWQIEVALSSRYTVAIEDRTATATVTA